MWHDCECDGTSFDTFHVRPFHVRHLSPFAGTPEEPTTTAETLQVDETEGLLLPSPGARRKQIDKKTVDKLQAISTDLLSQVGKNMDSRYTYITH